MTENAVSIPSKYASLERRGTPLPGLRHADASCYWRVWGKGPALLLLHGGAGSWLHWAPVIEVLANNHMVLAPDMPGFGRKRGSSTGEFATLSHAIWRDLATAGLAQKIAIGAFSFGSLVAAHMAMSDPTRVRALTMVGPAGLSGPRRPFAKMEGTSGLAASDLKEVTRRNLLRFMLHNSHAATEDAVSMHLWNMLPRPVPTKHASRSDALDRLLPHVQCPLNIVWGDQDPTVAGYLYARTKHVGAHCPNATARVIPKAGHWLMQDVSNSVLLDALLAKE